MAEVEVQGVPDLLEGLCAIKGAMMATAAVMAERDGSCDTSRHEDTLSYAPPGAGGTGRKARPMFSVIVRLLGRAWGICKYGSLAGLRKMMPTIRGFGMFQDCRLITSINMHNYRC